MVTLDQHLRVAYFMRKACNALNIMLSAIQLRAQSFLLVTRLCIASKLVHLLRTLPLPYTLLKDFDEVVKDFERTGYASREFACPEAYGFATRYLEVTAPRPDRPILTVAYELATTDRPPKDVFA